MNKGEAFYEGRFLLATLPPAPQQRRLALAATVVLLVSFGLAAPFAATPLPRFDAFIPTIEGAIFLTDLITAILLFAQYAISRFRALLVAACAYLFTALIVVPHVLTYPGVFAPTGLLGAGLQSTGWLYYFWHIGFALALLAYAILRDENSAREADPGRTQGSALPSIASSIAIVTALVCALVWLATQGEWLLPRIFSDVTHATPLNFHIFVANIALAALAFVLLWLRRRSVLDLWLTVVLCALISELLLVGVIGSSRFALGFYAGRIFSLIMSTVVLAVLLAEMTRLYARLARTNAMLERERTNKLMTMEAVAASISHEMRQPLGAISLNASAAQEILRHRPANLEEAGTALDCVVDDTDRIGHILDSIRDLYGRGGHEFTRIDVNEIALQALRNLDRELKDNEIVMRIELASGLPPIRGHREQLQEVLVNLIHNAIEALEKIKDGNRLVWVATGVDGRGKVTVTVEDSGPGIDPAKLDGIFEAFVSSKPQGMGLGLAFCRMIVERHGGQLLALSRAAGQRGALFRLVLPAP